MCVGWKAHSPEETHNPFGKAVLRAQVVPLFFLLSDTETCSKPLPKTGVDVKDLWGLTLVQEPARHQQEPQAAPGASSPFLPQFTYLVESLVSLQGPGLFLPARLPTHFSLSSLDPKKAPLPDVHHPLVGHSPSHLAGHQATQGRAALGKYSPLEQLHHSSLNRDPCQVQM